MKNGRTLAAMLLGFAFVEEHSLVEGMEVIAPVYRVIPLLEHSFYVVCVSYDGFDETENTVFPSMTEETEKIEATIQGRFGGKICCACGICTLMGELGLHDLVPAMCRLDYTMSEAGGTSDFVREHTIASGGPYCDCGYRKRKNI